MKLSCSTRVHLAARGPRRIGRYRRRAAIQADHGRDPRWLYSYHCLMECGLPFLFRDEAGRRCSRNMAKPGKGLGSLSVFDHGFAVFRREKRPDAKARRADRKHSAFRCFAR